MGFRKHYTDEQLLAYVDGELPWVRRLLAAQHLRHCWACRQRTSELERDIESVTRRLSQSWRLAPGGTAKAKLRFRQMRGGYESAIAPRARRPRRWALVAGAAGLAVLAGFWLRTGNSPATPDGSTLLARAVRQAPLGGLAGVAVPAGDIVQQSFEVTFAELPEGERARQARVDLFFERGSARASAQWTDGAGRAVFVGRYDGESSVVRDAGGVIRRARLSKGSGLDLAQVVAEGGDLAQLEAAFGRWLEQKCWEPVSLAADFAQFAEHEGAGLVVERQPDGGLQLNAIWSRVGERYEAALNLDPGTLRVRQSQVRLWRGNRCVEISFRPAPLRVMPARLAARALFDVRGLAREEAPRALAGVDNGPTLALDPRAVWELEVALHAALHNAGLCGADPVEIKASRTGITISGVVRDESQLRSTLAAIRAAQPPAWVGVSLQTVAEAMAEQRPGSGGRAEEAQEGAAVSSRIRANDLLVAYFRQGSANGREAVEQRVSDFARQSVESSEQALMEAWSYQYHSRVMERSGEWDASPRAAAQMAGMLNDHLERVARAAGFHLELLGPVMERLSIQPQNIPTGGAGNLPRRADQTHRLALALFAAGSNPQPEAASEGETLSQLYAELRALIAECDIVQQRDAQARRLR